MIYKLVEVLNYAGDILNPMKIKPLPSIEVLNNLLNYDPATGDLTWKIDRGKVKAGDIAGSINKAGYRLISIRQGGKVCNYMAHRIAWALYHGEDPYPDEIDHKNRSRGENWIGNLRLTTRSLNGVNRGVSDDSVSGCNGVTWIENRGKWRVMCGRTFISYEEDLGEAIAARHRHEAAMLQSVTGA